MNQELQSPPANNLALYRTWWTLGLLAVAAWLAPTFWMGEATWRCHAMWYDVLKTMGTWQGWQQGIDDGRWFQAFDEGYGYPSLSYYAPFFYWLSAALMGFWRGVADDPYAVSLAIRCTLALFLTMGLTGMLAGGEWLWNRVSAGRLQPLLPGLICALGWWMAPWPVFNVYVRGSNTEFCAYQLMPWIFAAAVRWHLDERHNLRWPLIAAALLAVSIMTHNHAGIVLCGFAMMLPLILAPVAAGLGVAGCLRRSLQWCALVVPIALLLSSVFWLPALMESPWVLIERATKTYTNPMIHAVHWSNLLRVAFYDSGFSRPGTDDSMGLHLGLVSVLALMSVAVAAAGWIRTRKMGAAGLAIVGLFLASAAATLLTTSLTAFIWNNVGLLRQGQFPWRLLMLPSFGVAMLLPAAFSMVTRESALRIRIPVLNGLLIVAMMSFFCYFRVSERMAFPDNYRFGNWTKVRLIANDVDEFRPRWAEHRQKDAPAADSLIPAEGIVAKWTDGFGGTPRTTLSAENPTSATLPLVVARNYMPPWRAMNAKGDAVQLSPAEGTGFLQLEVPPGSHSVTLRYGLSPLRTATRWISGIAWLMVLGALALMMRRARIDV